MQSKTFGRLCLLAVVIISLFVLVHLSRQAAEKTPFLVDDLLATSSAPTATTTGQVSLATVRDAGLNVGRATIDVRVPHGVIRAIVASTSEQVELGLGGRSSLPKDGGMLFIFPKANNYGFWMKDMKFPIDIVWMGEDRKALGVTPRLSPDTYPNIYYANTPTKYVLELNAGAAAEYGIATGTRLVF